MARAAGDLPAAHEGDNNTGDERMAQLTQRIATLEERLQALKVRQRRIEGRRRALDSQRERRQDTRRKILVGALILAQVPRGEYPKEQLRATLDRYLTRPDERALFVL